MLVYLLFFLLSASSEEPSLSSFQSRSIGHLLTSNNYTLPQNGTSIGSMYAGYGITDQWTVVTSPFVWASFYMLNFTSRYATSISTREKIGFDLGYFKTLESHTSEYKGLCSRTYSGAQIDACAQQLERTRGFKNFQMEAASTKLSYTRLLRPSYRFSFSLSYFYYWDDRRPFSLRMDPQNNDKYSLSLTTLHEIQINKKKYINLEAGFWGLNYHFVYYHIGASYSYQTENWLWSLGASSTLNPSFPKNREREFNFYNSSIAIHPEIQIQYFF